MDQKVNPIQPPPSVDDLLALGTDTRLGQVDFATVVSPITATPVAAPARTPIPAPRPTPRPVVEAVPETGPVAEQPTIELAPVRTPAAASSPAQPAWISDDTAHLGDSVREVADAAIERLRDAENATLLHLRALEAEAARRAELLTAQAELDAELIRLNARREAHAIITAAHARTGDGPSAVEGHQLGEISDAVSRFAESIEPSLVPLRSGPDLGDPS